LWSERDDWGVAAAFGNGITYSNIITYVIRRRAAPILTWRRIEPGGVAGRQTGGAECDAWNAEEWK
jgi:hypothetical protein